MTIENEDDFEEVTSDLNTEDTFDEADTTEQAPDDDASEAHSQILDSVNKYLGEEEPEVEETVVAEEAEPEVAEEPEQEEEPETEPEAEENAEETEETEEPSEFEARQIPYERFQKVIRQKNENKTDAETWRQIRKVYTEAGIKDEAYQTWSKLGVLVNTDMEKAKPFIEALAKAAGLQTVSAIPQDLQKMVDDGLVDEQAAHDIAAKSYKPVTDLGVDLPSFSPTTANPGEAVTELASSFDEAYPGIFTPKVVAGVMDEIKAEINEYETKYGMDFPPDRVVILAEQACKNAVKIARHKPAAEVGGRPLRPTAKPPSKGKTGSVRDFVRSNPFLTDI